MTPPFTVDGPPSAPTAAARQTVADGGRRTLDILKWVICGALLFALAGLTWRQSRAYHDLETLWRATILRNPDSAIAHNNLAAVLLAQNRADEALAHAQRALEFSPGAQDDALARVNLGNALLQKQHVGEAAEQFRKAVEIQPDFADAQND